MNTRREVEALDEALLYLNEVSNPTYDKNKKIIEKVSRAIRYYFQINGATQFSLKKEGIRFLGGAARNKKFIEGKDKSFVLVISGVQTYDMSYGIFKGTDINVNRSFDNSEVSKLLPMIVSKKKNIEDTVFERTGIKVSIKAGDPHALTEAPTIVITVK